MTDKQIPRRECTWSFRDSLVVDSKLCWPSNARSWLLEVLALAALLVGVASPALAARASADLEEGERISVVVQWEAPSEAKPWLREVRILAMDESQIPQSSLKSVADAPMPKGVRVRLDFPPAPADTTEEEPSSSDSHDADAPIDGLRVQLAEGYGFTLSADLLRKEPFIWLKDVGVFASARGTFESLKPKIEALEATAIENGKKPFQSPSEGYWKWLGKSPSSSRTAKLDAPAFEYAYEVPRPLAPRVQQRIEVMPEVDYDYFCKRVEDKRYHRIFLGWPNVAQEYVLRSNGRLGVNVRSSLGTGHPTPAPLEVDFAIGDSPRFRRFGDTQVKQSLEDGFHVAVHTEWSDPGASAKTSVVAYPLEGEEVTTGWETLGAFARFERTSGDAPLWLRVDTVDGTEPFSIKDGRLLSGDRILLAIDQGRMELDESSDRKIALVKILPKRDHVDIVVPYVAVDRRIVDNARKLGFKQALSKAKRYWNNRLAKGARFDLPDSDIVLQYKTFYPRVLITGDLDTKGIYALKTSPERYEAVWLHCTSYGIEALSRRGHFEEAKQYLEAGFAWQGSQSVFDAPQYTTWEGFFNAPPWYTENLWVNFHGWFQWASARYFLLSDDRGWLDDKLPALIRSLEWTASQRKLTMKKGPDGARAPNYGWLPPGQVTDHSVGTSIFSDCPNWLGMRELVRVLDRIDHPRAGEFRAIADDYRACIIRGVRLAAANRDPVRLADGTFVPYVPGYLESKGHEEYMWYAAVVDAALIGILDCGILDADDPMEDWIRHNLQDNLFVLSPNLGDEGHFLGQACSYVRRNMPEMAIYTLYSCLASQMARETRTTFEHRSHGSGTVYELTPWAMGYFNRLLSGMLCNDENNQLAIGAAMPRAWLDPGEKVTIEGLQTEFGPVNIHLEGHADRVTGQLDLPTRQSPAASTLRLRVHGKIESVSLNGRKTPLMADGETVALPVEGGPFEIEAIIRRKASPLGE